MNVPVQRTNGWRSRVPLPDEREQRTPRLSEWAVTPLLTAVLAYPRAAGGERRSLKLHTYTPVGRAKPGEFQLRHGGADNEEKEKFPRGEPLTTLRNFVRQIFRWWAEGRQSQHPTTHLFGRAHSERREPLCGRRWTPPVGNGASVRPTVTRPSPRPRALRSSSSFALALRRQAGSRSSSPARFLST